MANFVHLHVHSEYSLLDGLSKIPKLITQAKLMGMKHLALTDHGSLYGAIKFYKEARQEGVNPIIGSELYIAPRSHKDKESQKDSENYHLTVLALDSQGYKNLMKLVTLAHLDGFYYRPRVDREILTKYSKGLIALSGCSSSEVSKALIAQDLKKAKEIAKKYIEIFGHGNYFIEVQRHLFGNFKKAHEPNSDVYNDLSRMEQEEAKIIKGAKELSKLTLAPIVATNDVHYVVEDDAPAQDAIVCIQTGKTISETKRLRMIDSPTYYLKSTDEMQKLFADMPQAITNSEKIAQRVKIDIALKKVAFPHFEVPKKNSPDDYLKSLCFEGLKNKGEKITSEIVTRLEYELSIIAKKGYSTYFLIVADFVKWARENSIIFTTRGSVSGSLVSYTLGITNVNPLFFKLPFERFLNLYRPSLPDIDVDFEDDRRDEVIAYVRSKYGDDRVAQIGTFGTMMARAAVRDVARVLGLPYAKADRVAKMIPIGAQGFHVTLADAKKQNKELGALYKTDEEVKELLDLAEKVEGNVRHVSVHAAGVVISPSTLTDFVPLSRETTGQKIITQYDMYDVEEVGLVKMDFLGIRNLSILGKAVEIVKKTKNIDVDLSDLSYDDRQAFELLGKGETMGLFQLSGSGMTRYLKELKPTSIFDIMAMISLFRPGPMNSIPEFIERKHNRGKIKYFDLRMKDYLEESYGVIVYQDDVLLTVINIAGYTWEEADNFRKAIGKKIPAEMSKQKEKFLEGCIKNGLSSDKASQLFKLIEPFAAYGFNKAHAASYAVIAYETAYMKANYPVEFMTAVMSAESDDPNKIASAVDECSRMGISVLPPDINKSDTAFVIEEIDKKSLKTAISSIKFTQGIRFGLSAIKNVGKAAIEAILIERNENDKFNTLDDFAKRVNLRVVNRKTFESLIKAGAMDQFGPRNAMLRVLEELKSSGASIKKTIASGQGSLFEGEEFKQTSQTFTTQKILETVSEAPREELLSWERELLGFYLTEHPLAKISDELWSNVTVKIGDIETLSQPMESVKLGGIIISTRKTFTKISREEMCFLKLQDTTGTVEVIVFPKTYALYKSNIILDKIVIISGKLEIGEENPILIAEKVNLLDFVQSQKEELDSVEVSIPKETDRILLSKIYEVLKDNQGENQTFLVMKSENGSDKKIPLPFGISISSNLKLELERLGCSIVG